MLDAVQLAISSASASSVGHHLRTAAWSPRTKAPREQQRAVPRAWPGAPDDLEQDPCRDHRDGTGDARQIRPSFEFASTSSSCGTHRRRHDRRLRDHVRLLQHQRREHQREQGQGVDVARPSRSSTRRGRPATSWMTNRRPPATRSISGPISGAIDQERREAEDQEQHHPRSRRIEIDVEEQRIGERDDHRRVAAHHQRMGDRQATELRRRRPRRARRFHRGDRYARVRIVRTCSRDPGS